MMENRIKQYFEMPQPVAQTATPMQAPAEQPRYLNLDMKYKIPLNHPRMAEILFTVQYLNDLMFKK